MNDHALVGFVRLGEEEMPYIHKFIEKIVFTLHPTFLNPVREVVAESGKPIELPETAWGSFDLGMQIIWNEETGITEPTNLKHFTSFIGDGEWQTIKIPIAEVKYDNIMQAS